MTVAELGNYRIAAQGIATGKFKKPAEAVAHLGAMQAQDFPMSRWAVGLRTAKTTEADILMAYNKGEIIRTHVLRPTWHLVANADVDWMLRLTAPGILTTMRSRHKQLGLSEAGIIRSHRAIEKALAKGPVTREALIQAMKAAKIDHASETYPHLFVRAELDRIICSGPMQGIHPTFALFAERVKKAPVLKRDEALAQLAERYFASRGPATLADFIWWSGLKISDARTALAATQKQFRCEKIAGATYLMPKASHPAPDKVYLLPAFDEFIIGYADRSAVLPHGMSPKVVSNNGIFRATIVVNGVVQGVWKRAIKNSKLIFAADYSRKVDAKVREAVDRQAAQLAKFLDTTRLRIHFSR